MKSAMLAILFLSFSLCATQLFAQASESKPTNESRELIQLWPQGLPPGATTFSEERIAELKKKETKQRLTYVQDPTLEVFLPPAEKANGCAVIVCPGGGYNILAIEHEGIEIAEWLNSIGVTAFVLRYRIPRRTKKIHAEPMQDVQRAVRLVRHRAKQYKIDSSRLGVLGFSAGGHLTLMSGLQAETKCYDPVDEIDRQNAKPNFLCPIYAAYMGPEYNDRNTTKLSDLMTVSKSTPPMFMAVTLDDAMRGAQAAALLVRLKENKVPAELHVYVSGGHGYGIRKTGKPVANWNAQLADWLDAMKLTNQK